MKKYFLIVCFVMATSVLFAYDPFSSKRFINSSMELDFRRNDSVGEPMVFCNLSATVKGLYYYTYDGNTLNLLNREKSVVTKINYSASGNGKVLTVSLDNSSFVLYSDYGKTEKDNRMENLNEKSKLFGTYAGGGAAVGVAIGSFFGVMGTILGGAIGCGAGIVAGIGRMLL